MKTKLDKYFRISQRGSTIGTELIGGATTFATMAYILAYMSRGRCPRCRALT